MSKLGYIYNSYGSQINIAIANTYGYVVANSKNLPQNALIFTSDINNTTYSILITDYNSEPIRLTYTIYPSNGLNNDGDTLSLDINDTLSYNNKGLNINTQNIISYNIHINNESYLYIDTSDINIASLDNKGIFAIDNNTIKLTNENKLYVETNALDIANNNVSGIIKGDDNTVAINNGIISINTYNLEHASNINNGIVKPDGNLIIINKDDKLTVNTDNLLKCSNTQYGIVKPDNSTIISDNGKLKIITSALQHASETQKGIIKFDNNYDINDGIVSFKDYNNILDNINYIETNLDKISKIISDYDK